jgi:acyl-CoA reductase-like NAD-dependent aldehyde dehydrogenase
MPAEADKSYDPINRTAVQWIDDALRKIADEVDARGSDGELRICLSVGGAIPEYRDQIRAAAKSRFKRARFLDQRNRGHGD